MEKHIVFKGGNRPSGGGFATPHLANRSGKEPPQAVNGSLGSVHRAGTRDTEPHDDPKADRKGATRKTRA